MNRVAIQRVGIWSAFKFGFVLGALTNIVPALSFALISKWIISTVRATLEGWQNVEVGSLFGQSAHVDLITALNLDALLKGLQVWDALSPLGFLLIVLAIVLFGGLALAITTGLLAGVYNVIAKFSGGLAVELAGDALVPTPARNGPAGAWLTGAQIPGGSFALTQNPTRIGRDASNHLVLASSQIAPVHAELVLMNGRWILRDLSPNNSTFVNDRPVRENMLKDGFRMRLGDVELVFRSV